MPATRCLASVLPLAALVTAARPRLESALLAPGDECDRFSGPIQVAYHRAIDPATGEVQPVTDPATGEVLCRCWSGGAVANSQCSRPGQVFFPAVGSAPGCRCEEVKEWAQSVKSPVETAALSFCEAAAKVSSIHSPEVPSVFACQAELNGTAKVGHGRLDAFLQHLPKTAAWHLSRVCNDECKELVHKTKKEMNDMLFAMKDAVPIGETCAARVVKKVEAEILGCCGRSCGWNGHSCISWPFFDEQQKADWLAECCTEYNVLKNSSREDMCNSVLNQHDADLVSKNDMSQDGRDVAAAYVGQDSQLFWTEEGVDSELGRNYSWLRPKPKAGEEVTERLLQLQPNIRKMALKKRWFKEKKLERASFMQMQDTGGICDPQKMVSCTPDMQKWRTNVCAKQEGWLSSHIPGAKCKKMRGTEKLATSPHKCFEAKYDKVDAVEIKSYAFQYNTKNKENPIRCYAESGQTSCTVQKTPLAEAKATNFDTIWFWIDASNAKSAEGAQTAP